MRALLTVAILENFTVHYQLPLIYCNINSITGTEGGPVISSAKNKTTQEIQESPCGIFVRSYGASVFLWLQRTKQHDINMYLSKVKYDHADRSEPSVVGTRALLLANATIFVSACSYSTDLL